MKLVKFIKRGFTLMELLVAIMIVGILAAVAVPQYQKAVMKSRFAAMIPIAKTLANANEVYYAEHDEYSTDPAKLNVTPQAGTPDGTAINMYSNPEEVSFVRVENPGVPNARYVVYQKLSENFPETTWCEAGDTRTEELCIALGGTLPDGLTGNSSGDNTNYKAYLLTGQARSGDSFAETGAETETPTEPEPQTPTCEGEAPTKQEACSSGCGSVTVTAVCEEGEWVYPTNIDTSSCPDKPDDETVECPTGCGSVTVTAVCEENEWIYPTADTSSCSVKPNDKTVKCPAGCGSVTVTAACEEDEWVYPTADTSSCPAKPKAQTAPCEDSRFSGTQTRSATCNSAGTAWEFTGSWSTTGCTATHINQIILCEEPTSCTNSSFSGGDCGVRAQGACRNNIYTNGARCVVYSNLSYSGCNDGTFMDGTVCNAQGSSSCNGGTFKSGSACLAISGNTCQSTFEEGSCCLEGSKGACPKGTSKCVYQVINGKYVYSPDPSGATW